MGRRDAHGEIQRYSRCLDRFREFLPLGAHAPGRVESQAFRDQAAALGLAGGHLSGGVGPASWLVPILLVAVPGRKRRDPIQDRADARLPGGRRSRKKLQEKTGAGWLRKTPDGRGLREKVRRRRSSPVG